MSQTGGWRRRNEDVAETLPALSEGEKQCLRLVAQGFNSKEIARQLHVSEHTVDQRVRTSLRKFGVPSRKEAARLFVSVVEQSPQSDTYQPLIYQSEPLASDPEPASSLAQPDRPDVRREPETLLRRILAFGPPLGPPGMPIPPPVIRWLGCGSKVMTLEEIPSM